MPENLLGLSLFPQRFFQDLKKWDWRGKLQ
jgi:hypothetical protein